MIREEARLKFRAKQYYTEDGDLVIPRTYAYDIIDEIFDEHEMELKSKDEEIENITQQLGFSDIYIQDLEAQLKAKDEEIALLKQCVEEAIKRPMGVEPSLYSDYKMLKDNQ